MANNKLYITISDERKGGGDGPTPTPKPNGSSNKDKESPLLRYAEHEMMHLVKSQVNDFVNFTLGNIGNFTGDYITQRKVNSVKQAISGIESVAMATLGGATYGMYGAAIGFVVGVASLSSKSIYEVAEKTSDNKKTNYDIAQLRERAGLNSTRDGGRGTEN